MTLTEFLTARFAEREEAIRQFVELAREADDTDDNVRREFMLRDDAGYNDPLLGARLLRTLDPSRMLAEVAAKRRIVARWDELDGNDPKWRVMDDQTAGQREEWEETLRALASVYADHPQYQEEWHV